MRLLAYLLINGLAVFMASQIIPGIQMDGYVTALMVVIIFGLLNTFLKPLLTLLTLPLTIFTLGLFLLVINIVIVFLTAQIVPGFVVDGWLSALLFSIMVSVISWFLSALNGK